MRVELTDRAKRQLKSLSLKQQEKVINKLQLIKISPFVGKKLSGEYIGRRSIRAWPYRIIYITTVNKDIIVLAILHRQGAYK